jgi:hypothetical protein
MHSDPANYVTAFSLNSSRHSIFEIELYDHVIQDYQTILWRGNSDRNRNWLFNHDSLLSRVLMERGIGDKRKKLPGTIVAFCKADVNEGPLFKVIYVFFYQYLICIFVEYQIHL